MCQKHTSDYKKTNEWTAVICLWKRDKYIVEQVDAIEAQTIKPKSIIILKNENHIKIPDCVTANINVKVINSNINNLYFRWLIPYLIDTEFVCIFDDDVIPGSQWIERCLNASAKNDLLIGASGRKYKEDKQPPWISINPTNGKEFVYCDWVCNSYFFKSEWVKYIVKWQRFNNSIDTLDDIHLAQSLRFNGNIKSAVLVQPNNEQEKSGNNKKEYGRDEHALWLRPDEEHQNKRADYAKLIF